MADYGCFLWTNSPQLYRFRDDETNLDPALLGASPGLVERLTAWHREWEDAAYSDQFSAGRWDELDRRGVQLAHELQTELGPGIEVWFSGSGDDGVGRPVRELPLA